MIVAIICAAIVYILMTNLATLNFPERFQTSATYLHNLKTLTGIEGVPTFFVVSETFGGYGLLILGVVISATLVSSIGTGKLFYISGMGIARLRVLQFSVQARRKNFWHVVNGLANNVFSRILLGVNVDARTNS